ncbi:GNAT family N-acetyltransferase [Georgenia sp. Z1344]|uniref:GNAT family N-acetyltransferase n=1 Tax=Georgenia sp. Z1344 TaxID=3416706 RepID=UPI003CECC085
MGTPAAAEDDATSRDELAPDAAPAQWEADVVLRDGATMHIRPISPDDAEALADFHAAQSERSQYLRFFAPMPRLSPSDVHRFTNVDHDRRVALVLTEGPSIRGVGRYDVVEDGTAEVAFAVADSEQGRGLGSILLEHVVAAARERGVHTFVADVLPDNTQMIRVFSDAGYEVRSRYDDGVVAIEIPLRSTGRSWEVLAERERRAESLSMHTLTAARGAVVVALDESGRAMASRVLARARAAAGEGGTIPLVAVGDLDPAGVPHVADVTAMEEAVPDLVEGADLDLAVVAGEPARVVGVVPRLRSLGVRSLVVLTGGFAIGPGRELQLDLLRATRLAGLRVLGPASYGVLGRGPAGSYDLTLADPALGVDGGAPAREVGGRGVGVFAQTREAALALRRGAANRRLPEVAVVAAGNRIDVSGNDTMQGWSADDRIGVGIVHLQTLGNARKFTRVARRLSVDRALVVLTSATTAVATLPGHAVATSPLPPSVIDSVLAQAGALPARSVAEALDLAAVALTQPTPDGVRVALVATSHSLAATLSATARASGLTPVGPVVVLDSGPVDARERLQGVVLDEDVDAVVVAAADVLGGVDAELVEAVAAAAAADADRPWVAWVSGVHGLDDRLRRGEHVLPAVGSLDVAARSVALRAAAAARRDDDVGALLEPDGTDPLAARATLADVAPTATSGDSVDLDPARAADLLGTYGIEVLLPRAVDVPVESSDDDVAEAAVALARQVGHPVALKAADDVLRHRADLGGVRLDLRDDDDVAAAVHQVRERSREVLGRQCALEVQAMAEPGVAVVVHGGEDPVYGPVVSLGVGGDASEILGDRTYRVAPVTARDVATMITDLRAAARLTGDRGLTPVDTAALADLLARVAALVDDLPQIAALELNPVIVAREGLAVAGARVTLRAPSRLDAGRRTLPRPGAEGAAGAP